MKRNRFKLFRFFCLFIFNLLLIARVALSQDIVKKIEPKGIANPETAALFKFSNIPVGGYTGTPDISIPLFNLVQDGLELPIVLRYHASGIQVEQDATWVGLGWDLSVGGTVTQIFNEKRDQETEHLYVDTYRRLAEMEAKTQPIIWGQPYKFMLFSAPVRCRENELSPKITNPFTDPVTVDSSCWICPQSSHINPTTLALTEFIPYKNENAGAIDKYSFSVPTGSGEFYLDPFDNFKPVIVGKVTDQFEIIRKHNFSSEVFDWEIRDSRGNIFYFMPKDAEQSLVVGAPRLTSSGSKLTSIKQPSGKYIVFNYDDIKYTTTSYSESKNYNYYPDTGAGVGVANGSKIINNTSSEFQSRILRRIETETQVLEFELSTSISEREDIEASIMPDGSYGAKRLNAIHLFDKNSNRKIKSYIFNYDYFTSDLSYPRVGTEVSASLTKRLKLVSITEVGYDNTENIITLPGHSFEYNENILLPAKDSYARDHWGYFNGKRNTGFMPDLTPEVLSGTFENGSRLTDKIYSDVLSSGTANRGMSPIHAQTALLNKITYPTAGYSVLTYEPHKFTNNRIFSAFEAEPVQHEGYSLFSYADFNNPNSTNFGAPFSPNGGYLVIDRIAVSFSTSIPSSNIDPRDYLIGSYVKLWRRNKNNVNDITLVKGWYFHHNGTDYVGGTTNPEYLQFSVADNYEFYFEMHLNNAPEITTNSLIPLAVAGVSYSIRDVETLTKESIGAGLRVKSVMVYDHTNVLSEETEYDYTLDGTRSSGLLMTPLDYFSYQKYDYGNSACVMSECETIIYSFDVYSIGSTSYVPISMDAQGSRVGYSRVSVSKKGINANSTGKTVTYYKNKPTRTPSTPPVALPRITKSLPNIPDLENGLVDSVFYYATNDVVLKRTTYGYGRILDQMNYNLSTIIVDMLYGAPANEVYWFTLTGWNPNCLPGPEALSMEWECLDSDCYFNHHRLTGTVFKDKWMAVFIPTYTRWTVQNEVIETDYSGNSAIAKRTNFTFNALGQMVRSENTSSKGEVLAKQTSYPIDDQSSNAIIALMRQKRMLQLPLEEISFVNNSEVNRTKYTYGGQANGDIKLTQVQQSNGSNALFDVVNDIRYDYDGNLVQYSRNAKPKAYQWGYNQNYPVATVVNSTATSSVVDYSASRQFYVKKAAGIQQVQYINFEVGANGNGQLTVAPFGSGSSVFCSFDCAITGENQATGFTYSAGFTFCYAINHSSGSCSLQTPIVNLEPGSYTLAVYINSEDGLSVGNGGLFTLSYPDKKIVSDGSEFFYENYEDNGVMGIAHTGNKYSTSPNVSWVKPNARSYVISYWYRENNVWKYSGNISYTSDSYVMSGGDAYDDVRIHPVDAMMTTYTFNHLGGMTSSTDPSGLTTYFEFDAFGRFKMARDANQNIIKNYVYNYRLASANNNQ